MLQELSSMDRITQLQDEIQQILTIMSRSIQYLTSKADFVQISPEVPVTKQRAAGKADPPDVFDANKKELVTDLIVKAKQIEYLINSLPEPESEEEQAGRLRELENELSSANSEYVRAVHRARELLRLVSETLRTMLSEPPPDTRPVAPSA
ncbi:hypothetical protein BDN71DRAFT_1474802 [Pleurotus eryngii]|uniref:Mediator of RNA polymerase II transcription subunit 21 n=1 Tax=Pleurotus eryngii TaxID=5323 RepID=A0A9P6D590_PLEER|nr:hypothetical protein BDN71DRAFT_1474802 [Pleurotus eryngii]